MKKRNGPRIILTVIFAALLLGALSLTAAAATYNWVPLPTSPEGLSEGDWYIDLTHSEEFVNGETAILEDLNPFLKNGTWSLDEATLSVKCGMNTPGLVWVLGSIEMTPENYPVASRYCAYRFLTRVGQTWECIPGRNGSLFGSRLDFAPLAAAVIAADDTLTEDDAPALIEMWRSGEWFVEPEQGLLKGCWAVPARFSESGEDSFGFVNQSAEYFDLCVTNAPCAPFDWSHLEGTWGDNITWTLDDGTLTIGGEGEMARRTAPPDSVTSMLILAQDTVRFNANGSDTSAILFSEELERSLLATIGCVDADNAVADVALGNLSAYDYISAMYGEMMTVKTLVFEEGVTGADSYALQSILPETVILPVSLTQGGGTLTSIQLITARDLYITDPEADIAALRLPVTGYPEDFPYRTLEEVLNYCITAIAFEAQRVAPVEFHEGMLKEIFGLRNGFTGKYKTEADAVRDWNRLTGDTAADGNAVTAACVSALNGILGTEFTSANDVYTVFSSTAGETITYTAGYRAALDAYDASFTADDVPEEYLIFRTEESSDVWLGEAMPEGYVAQLWLTVHGYPGSTAEAAAAATGLKFLPICPAGVTLTVTAAPETAPSATACGYTAGYYCEDCGEYLSGHETVAPLAMAWGYCGADGSELLWTFDGSTLTVSGEGAIADYSAADPAPWAEFFAQPGAAIDVVLTEGVTRVGANAFTDCAALKRIFVLNTACDLSALDIHSPVFLRGYLGSTAETYGNTHGCQFMPLCPVDYTHEAVFAAPEAPTCVDHGYTPGVYCTVCGTYLYGHAELPLTDHAWSDWTVTKQPTADQPGEWTRTCEVCGLEEVTQTEPDGGNRTDPFDWLRRAISGLITWLRKLLAFFGK